MLWRKFGKGYSLCHELPPGDADVGRRIVYDVNTLNWYDHEPNTFHLSHNYRKPTNRQIDNLVWQGLAQNGFPIFDSAMSNEFFTGPYLARMVDSYFTNLRRDKAIEDEFVDLETLQMEEMPQNIPGVILYQNDQPETFLNIYMIYESVTTG